MNDAAYISDRAASRAAMLLTILGIDQEAEAIEQAFEAAAHENGVSQARVAEIDALLVRGLRHLAERVFEVPDVDAAVERALANVGRSLR